MKPDPITLVRNPNLREEYDPNLLGLPCSLCPEVHVISIHLGKRTKFRLCLNHLKLFKRKLTQQTRSKPKLVYGPGEPITSIEDLLVTTSIVPSIWHQGVCIGSARVRSYAWGFVLNQLRNKKFFHRIPILSPSIPTKPEDFPF